MHSSDRHPPVALHKNLNPSFLKRFGIADHLRSASRPQFRWTSRYPSRRRHAAFSLEYNICIHFPDMFGVEHGHGGKINCPD